MPEIPELEVLKDNLYRIIAGKRLTEFSILKPYIQKSALPDGLEGQKVTGVGRRGKYITIELEKHRLIVHLMLTGRFKTLSEGKSPHKTAAALMRFEDISLQLTEDATLKRMSMWIVEKSVEVDDIRRLGPEPLAPEFTLERLSELLASSRQRLKAFLVDQENLAGIGNAYADEICWQAELSPFKQSHKLTHEEIARLYTAISEVLTRAEEQARKRTGEEIEINEDRVFLAVHRRKGEPCPRCGTPVEWVSTVSRDTYYCPRCQTGGKVLADGRTSRFLK